MPSRTDLRRDRLRDAVHPPPALPAAVALLGAEGLVIGGLGVFLIVRGFGADTDDRGRAELGGLFAIVAAVGLGLLGRALLAGRSWARSPVVVVQLLCLPVAVSLLQGGRYGEGIPLVAVAVAILTLVGLAGGYRPRDSGEPRDPGEGGT
ncbi:hypothetical protein [Frankia sp. Cr2]|uniref:hypothetical protein n=1 Tax=Frankia sp. Cr2 TaxID=3073932 RepID=UPI002AD55184|nr:hypothetical protein [Frankia sp. Cr2]